MSIDVTRFHEIATARDAVALQAVVASILQSIYVQPTREFQLYPLDVPKIRQHIKQAAARPVEQKHDRKEDEEPQEIGFPEQQRVLAEGALICYLQRLRELATQAQKTPEELYMDILQHAHRNLPNSEQMPPFFVVHLPDGRRILTQEVKLPMNEILGGARRLLNPRAG